MTSNLTPADREAYRAANRTELRPPAPWKMAVVRALFVLLVAVVLASLALIVIGLFS